MAFTKRPKDIIRLRIEGEEDSVEQFRQEIATAISENKHKCERLEGLRVGKTVRIFDGPGEKSIGRVHFQIPASLFQLIIKQED